MIKENGGLKVAFGRIRVYSNQRNHRPQNSHSNHLKENLVKAKYLAKLEKAKTDPDKEPERDLRLEVLAKALKRELPVRAHAPAPMI